MAQIEIPVALPKPNEGPQRPAGPSVQDKQKALALGLELSKRSLDAASLDELFYILTNDLRSLMEYDRACLVVHLGGKTEFSAASNQPLLEKKTKFYQHVIRLGKQIRELDRGLLLSAQDDTLNVPDLGLYPAAKIELKSYIEFSGCHYLLCVPLKTGKAVVGHMIFEFLEKKPPTQLQILTLVNVSPFFAAALANKWLIKRKPRLEQLILPSLKPKARIKALVTRQAPLIGMFVALIIIVFFFIPFSFNVGGEAEVVPKEKYVAFVKIDGMIDKIFVKEGSRVAQGKTLATLDQKDIGFDIKKAQNQFDVLSKEMTLLRAEAGEKPAKLGESKVVELKRKSVWEELQFLKWKAQFIDITAPVSGIVITRDVDSLVGKRFKAGEPFCEMAIPGQLWVETLVPESKITYVKKGQEISFYLNSSPFIGYSLKVREIAPTSEVVPRLGNVYRVRAPFADAPQSIKVGLKGIGKIQTMDTSLWFIIGQRLKGTWNHFSLYF
ncbi:MAG: efflux RND transporter periplasmic adaptor subunit [Desulfomonilaceae bacterium]